MVLHDNEGAQREASAAGPSMGGSRKRGRDDGGGVVGLEKRQDWKGNGKGSGRGRAKI